MQRWPCRCADRAPHAQPGEPHGLVALHLPTEEVTAAAGQAKVVKVDHELALLLPEWLARDDITCPAMNKEGGLPNCFTINDKANPSTDTVKMRSGEATRFRFMGSNTNRRSLPLPLQ